MRRTDKSLLEQMQISDAEILHRMGLLGLDKKALDQLPGYKVLIESNVDKIVDDFYKKQTETDEIALLIGDADTLLRLRDVQRKYVVDLFSGKYDAEYVNNRLRIGMVHKRIGVEPKYYLSAVRAIKELIVTVLRANISEDEELEKALDALDKLFYFDTTLVFDTYIDGHVGEIQSAKNRTEVYAKSLEDKVAERTKQLEQQAKIDPLTDIYNQRAMQDVLRKDIAVAKRRQSKLSLVYFDIDEFKQINDKFGHLKGDEVLKSIGKILLKNIREVDTACRYGGDEFCLILPDCNIHNAKTICERIIKQFISLYPDFSLSIGIAETGSEDYVDVDVLIQEADDRMYSAKEESGSQIRSS